jgi:N-acyl-D-aspartate/D-glutamate deacylase
MWADIVVFDPQSVRDTATFEQPHSNSEGFAYVLVNGAVVIESNKHTGARPGQILLGPGVAGHRLQ